MPVNFKNIKTTQGREYDERRIQQINDSLQYLPIKQRASVLASIIEESGGNPLAKSSTEKYQGLLQWGRDRYAISSDNPDEELASQVEYMRNTFNNTTDRKSWTNGGKGSGYNSLNNAYGQFDDQSLPLSSILRGFSYGYVRPEGKEASYNNRLKVASQVYDRIDDYEKHKIGPAPADNTPFKEPSIKKALENMKAKGGKLDFLKPETAWDSLSLPAKAEMMRVAIANGIFNLNDIKKRYNEYAEGGPENNGNPRPITTGGAGYIPPSPNFDFPKNIQEVRLRLYNQVSPSWGFTDDTIKAALSTLLYNRNAFNSNTEESSTENISIGDPYVDSVWAEYLQIPEDKRRSNYRLEPSDYRPTIGDNTNDTYYKIPIDKYKKEDIVRTGLSLPLGKNKVSRVLESYNHGDTTVGRGFDPNNGEYISYYDRWDLNPFSSRHTDVSIADSPIIKFLGLKDNRKYGDLSFGIGKPINFYDRIYLDDYYDIPDNKKGSYFLPEITITPQKSLGGPLVQLANRYAEGSPFL